MMRSHTFGFTRLLPVVILVGFGLLGALAGGVVTRMLTPMYESSTTQLVVASGAKTPQELVAMNDYLLRRVPSYLEMLSTEAITQPVIDDMKLDMTPADVSSRLSTEGTPQSLLLKLTYRDPDPERAVEVVAAVARQAARYIPSVEDTTKVGTRIKLVNVSSASVPKEPTSPSLLVNVAAGLGAGLLLGYLVLALLLGGADRRTAGVASTKGEPDTDPGQPHEAVAESGRTSS